MLPDKMLRRVLLQSRKRQLRRRFSRLCRVAGPVGHSVRERDAYSWRDTQRVDSSRFEQSDRLARRELLASSVDDVYATVMRQAYFVLFEIEAHAAIRQGCTIEDLSELYIGKLREQFGDSVTIPPEFRNEWLGIPHIYQTPFYCYAYSFGQLLVLALYRRYQEQGEAFKPGYLRLLSYGGSARPQAILTETGIDITDRAFWQGGFDLVSERIDELERL